ncbi:MAG: hypothetical protein NC420_05585 [Eubacterium sp.]|nr:hypothetical protein [Eubacterium sp.]
MKSKTEPDQWERCTSFPFGVSFAGYAWERRREETELENSLGTETPERNSQLRPLQMKFLSEWGRRREETELE